MNPTASAVLVALAATLLFSGSAYVATWARRVHDARPPKINPDLVLLAWVHGATAGQIADAAGITCDQMFTLLRTIDGSKQKRARMRAARDAFRTGMGRGTW